jgi:hypothetical protein
MIPKQVLLLVAEQQESGLAADSLTNCFNRPLIAPLHCSYPKGKKFLVD